MNYNTDGFNERSIYIHNSNDMNKLTKNGPTKIDNSFVKMKVEENKANVKNEKDDYVEVTKEVRGNVDNFVLRNQAMKNYQNNLWRNDMLKK